MSKTKQNIIYNISYTVLNMVLPLLTAPYLARIIGAQGVGTFTFNFSIAQYVVLVAKLGLTSYGTREIARVRDDERERSKVFLNLWFLQIISTIIVSLAFAVYTVAFSGTHKSICFILSVWVFASFLDIDWFWFGLQEFKKTSIRNIIVKSIAVVLIFVYVKKPQDIGVYTTIMVGSYIVGYVILWGGIPKRITFQRLSLKYVSEHVIPCLLMLLPLLAVHVYRTMDKVMLGALSSMVETGIYENGEKMVYCLSGLITAVGTVMLPRMTELYKQNYEEQAQIYLKLSLRLMVILTTVCACGLVSISESAIRIMFGAEFSKSAIIMILIAPTLIPIGWSNVIRTQYIIPKNKDDIFIKSILGGCIINVVFNLIFIPRYGSIGAAWGTIVAEFFVPVYQYLRLKKLINYMELIAMCIPYVIIGAIMAVVVRGIYAIIGASVFTVIIQIAIGGVVFAGLALCYIQKRDLEMKSMLKGFVKKRV